MTEETIPAGDAQPEQEEMDEQEMDEQEMLALSQDETLKWQCRFQLVDTRRIEWISSFLVATRETPESSNPSSVDDARDAAANAAARIFDSWALEDR